MAGGELLAAAAAGLSVAAIMREKRRIGEEWLASHTLPEPGQKPSERAAPLNSRGYAAHVIRQGNFVRGLDMNRRTSDGRIVPHWGVDIAGDIGTPVYALKAGTIIHTGPQRGYGNTIHLRMAEGPQTAVYAHLHDIRVPNGIRVPAGFWLGTVGRSTAGPDGRVPAWGQRMGPHLHMEIHPTGTPHFATSYRRLDPVAWLRAAGIAYAQERRG